LSEQRAAEAFQAYSKKDYAAAVALYLQAYEAAPSGSILYNIARIYDTKLADRPLAISFYRRYIADPGAYTERIELANQRLKQLREAEALTATLSGSDAKAKDVDAPAARAQSEHPRTERAPNVSQRAETGWSTLRWTGVAFSVLGVAALGTGAGFGLAAMSRASTARELCDGNACISQRGVDAAGSADRAATISNIGFLAGGGLVLTGATLFLLGGDASSEKSGEAGLGVNARASSSSAALEVSGRW
jgi:tetratricopeptide (TPR) repeat protein